MLAVLAAALFLVGFGLVVEGSIRGVTYALGLAIASFVVVWGAWIYHLPIPSTPENAITAAAQGAVLTSDGDYRGAVAAYDRAIAAHEDFATAYTGRARASLLAANPDYPLTRAFTDSAGSRTAAAVKTRGAHSTWAATEICSETRSSGSSPSTEATTSRRSAAPTPPSRSTRTSPTSGC